MTQLYATGVRLTRRAMKRVEAYLTRQPGLSKWFVEIAVPAQIYWDS